MGLPGLLAILAITILVINVGLQQQSKVINIRPLFMSMIEKLNKMTAEQITMSETAEGRKQIIWLHRYSNPLVDSVFSKVEYARHNGEHISDEYIYVLLAFVALQGKEAAEDRLLENANLNLQQSMLFHSVGMPPTVRLSKEYLEKTHYDSLTWWERLKLLFSN